MSRKFRFEKDYHSLGYDLYKKGIITINPGVTVLVGCNGIGKSTLMEIMINYLKRDNIPYIKFDNLRDGGRESLAENFYGGNMKSVAKLVLSSEGESIFHNMTDFAEKIGAWIGDGKRDDSIRKFSRSILELHEQGISEGEKLLNERWIFCDAIDSGLSIDNIVDLKENLFNLIIDDQKGKNDVYIIVSANEYEMANGENCFDVYNGKYVRFENYEEYRNMVLESKQCKIERLKMSIGNNDTFFHRPSRGRRKI